MKKILISLVSKQTIPNVELIKEFKSEIDEYIFACSKQTDSSISWIIKASDIDINKCDKIKVDAFDIDDIQNKLTEYNFQDNNYYLNITGGTKIMIMAFYEFFKNKGARIYYVTGKDLEYIKIFPQIGERNFEFKTKITLAEYLNAYGFEFKESKPYKDLKDAQNIMSFLLKNDKSKYSEQFEKIRLKRGKNYSYDENISQFLKNINFSPIKDGLLNKHETKYLSGEWFEEYVFYNLKNEFNFSDNEIGTGYEIKKGKTPNELDVLFMYHNRFYIIECKTSVIQEIKQDDGKIQKHKLLTEIIYKSDALRGKLGLNSNTYIFTLEEIKNQDDTPVKEYETIFNRAELSRIKILSKKNFKSGEKIRNLLNIK